MKNRGGENPTGLVSAGYRRCRSGGYRGWLASGFSVAPEQLPVLAENGRVIKNRPKTLAAVNDQLFIKLSRHRGFWRCLRYNFRKPRPLRTLAGALRLAALKVATPPVLAALRRRRSLLVRCDLLVTAALPAETRFLDRYVHQVDRKTATELAVAAVKLLARIHAGGFEHGDLNLRNLYCTAGGDDGPFELGVIDLDGCRLSEQPLGKKRRRRELARLASSFLREEQRAAQAVHPDPVEYSAWFASRYLECTGIDLSGTALTERIAYLASRIRGK